MGDSAEDGFEEGHFLGDELFPDGIGHIIRENFSELVLTSREDHFLEARELMTVEGSVEYLATGRYFSEEFDEFQEDFVMIG